MLCKSDTCRRPLYLLKNGVFEVDWCNYSSDGQNIVYGDLKIPADHVKNLTPYTGVVSYGVELNGIYTVFDFSHTHLCKLQLTRIKNEIIRERSAGI